MKKYLLLLVFTLTFFMVDAQSETSLLKQIDDQVWKPFMNSFGKRNDTTFQSIHSREVARISVDDNSIIDFDEYFKKLPDSTLTRYEVLKSSIEIRHLKRIVSPEQAFETGYYKTTSQNTQTREKRTGYGKFTVLLRKENGIWKIFMDSDANEGTDEAVFQTGKIIQY